MKFNTRSAALVGMFSILLGSVALFGALSQVEASSEHHTVVPGDAAKWGPAPPSLLLAPKPPSFSVVPRKKGRLCSV